MESFSCALSMDSQMLWHLLYDVSPHIHERHMSNVIGVPAVSRLQIPAAKMRDCMVHRCHGVHLCKSVREWHSV